MVSAAHSSPFALALKGGRHATLEDTDEKEAQSSRTGQRRRVLLRDAAKGLYAQMYYWGVDVRHPRGNLLTIYGMTRIAKETTKGTSRYRLPWQDGLIELHGFCAGWYGPEGGIIFHRSRDAWLFWPHAHPPVPGSLNQIAASHPRSVPVEEMLRRVTVLMQWVREYENWAQRQWGVNERHHHHRAFLKLTPRRWWLPPELSLHWFEEFSTNPLQACRPKELLAEDHVEQAIKPVSCAANCAAETKSCHTPIANSTPFTP